MNLTQAVVYDLETFPNAFTCAMETLNGSTRAVWEISHFRDDRADFFNWLNWLARNQTPMLGFNNLSFDYPVLHYIMSNPICTVEQIYAMVQDLFSSQNRYGNTIWADKRYIPQIDLFKLHHFDNPAKSTSLKYLQVNMRTESVEDMPIENGTMLTKEQIDTLLIPYNHHDVAETKKFALHSMDALNFRLSLIPEYGVEVMNWNDTKIGEETVIKKLGRDVCYEYFNGRRMMRQSPRTEVRLGDVIFPYVQFTNPEFQRIKEYLSRQVLRNDELDTSTDIKTKGVFTDLKAHVGGVDFYFGVGGIHGSVERKRVVATDEWLIRDIDVASMYPSLAIANSLSPAHLGKAFIDVYSKLPEERKKWQSQKGKKCAEANALKLAANGVYGKSNSKYSVFYDPLFTFAITINGQLSLAMLIEKLSTIPSLTLLMANTDGVTYYINAEHEPTAAQYCLEWEKLTGLKLESTNFLKLFIRDVNNYLGEYEEV